MGLLDDKVAIITGAGGGLGEAYAKLFAKEGAAIVVNDLGTTVNGVGASAGAARVVADILEAGGRAVANGDDVSTMDGGRNILRSAIDAFGHVDILICNAGILRDRTFAKISEEDWDLVLKVHLKGTYCCTLPVWEWLKDNGRPGVIIMTSSTSGLFGNFGQANYGAAKAAIYGLIRVLSIEGRKYGIRVMGVAPNAITRMWAGVPVALDADRLSILRPENVAPGVLFLASDLAADHSGKVIAISGEEIAEAKMLMAQGFQPKGPYTAQDVAAHAASVFFPGDPLFGSKTDGRA
ncbi:short-chain dehydrogenase [Bradyrhizobium nanningense]|uniref:SDR family NAD(P)-dependent oxidoreductase n=1 Tax=Bradyrhizobium nanningense TaxID=1325118 RepID=UPI001008FFA1|nr:SDR family NAD(P)-dependent oxidoreductase [Bradyrhizobium nanningense]RXH24769.1 short-chain dehydrogenase [Bradyrhizobium nanningense]